MDGKDQSDINSRFTRKNRGQRAMGETQLSYNTASHKVKQLLKKLGYNADRHGESSAERTLIIQKAHSRGSLDGYLVHKVVYAKYAFRNNFFG